MRPILPKAAVLPSRLALRMRKLQERTAYADHPRPAAEQPHIYAPCNPRLIRRLPPPRAIAKALRPHFGRSAFIIANSQLISARADLWRTFAAQTRTPRASHGRLQASRRADSPRIGFMARTRAASSLRKFVLSASWRRPPRPAALSHKRKPRRAAGIFWDAVSPFWRLRASGGCGFPD